MLTSPWTKGTGQSEDELVPGLRNGLLFKPRGPLTLATGSWTAVIRFKQSHVQAQAENLRGKLLKIDGALQMMQTRWNQDQSPDEEFRGGKFVGGITGMWQRERAWMETEIQEAEAEIRELRTELRLSRRARGLINAFGDGLKWLFGTATEEDTRKLHKQIEGVDAKVGKLHHIAELQTTLIGSLTKEQRTNTRNIAILANKTMELERLLTDARQVTQATTTNIRREMDFSRSITSAIRTAGAAVITFRQEVKQITQAMEHTQQGRVTPVIMSPSTLKTTISSITAHLPDEWIPAVPRSAAPADIYKFLDIRAVALADGWEVHIHIPIQYRPYSQFQLYEVTAIPTHFQNLSYAIQTVVPAKFFAISRDQRLHLEAKEHDIDHCKQASGRTMCHELTPLIKETREGCLYHAYRDDRKKSAEECERIVVRPEPQIYAITSQKWIYVLPRAETFSMQCTGSSQPTQGFRLQGTGVFSLPPGCAAMGDHYIVPAHLRRQSRWTGELKLSELTHFKIDINISALTTKSVGQKPINETMLTKIMERMPQPGKKNPTLNELNERIENWKDHVDGEADYSPNSYITHTSLSLSTLGVLGVIGLIFLACRHSRRPSHQPVPQSVILPTLPQINPTNPDQCAAEMSEIRARLTKVEERASELQNGLLQISRQQADIEQLKANYEQLTCPL